MIPIVFPLLRYSRASWSTSVLLPDPGAPVSPIICALPLCGKRALSSFVASGALSSIAEIARAIARTSPAWMRCTKVFITGDAARSASKVVSAFAIRDCSHRSGELHLQQLARDYQPLDLARSLADRAQLHIAIILLCRIIFDKPISAVNLHTFIRAAHRHFAGIELGH